MQYNRTRVILRNLFKRVRIEIRKLSIGGVLNVGLVGTKRQLSLASHVLMHVDVASMSMHYPGTLITIKLHAASSYCNTGQSSNGYRLLLECKRSSRKLCRYNNEMCVG